MKKMYTHKSMDLVLQVKVCKVLHLNILISKLTLNKYLNMCILLNVFDRVV